MAILVVAGGGELDLQEFDGECIPGCVGFERCARIVRSVPESMCVCYALQAYGGGLDLLCEVNPRTCVCVRCDHRAVDVRRAVRG
eukprot:6433515-Prymnesium_polylepis.2